MKAGERHDPFANDRADYGAFPGPRREGKIPGQQRDEIHARYQNGEPTDRLASEFDITAGHVRRIGGRRT
jgi:hypothetical protein